jgi:imidazolonepropionase-like amidohydrolase/ABC-type multidrug transport system permease subunit
MRTYLAYTRTTLKLVMRDRIVLFFNYLLPLLFFVVFAQSFRADRGGAITQVITMVLIFGVLGSGFFGAGLRAVQERELGILRRFKVAPITPMPILVASLATGLISYLPGAVLILGIAHFFYGMPWPERWGALLILLSLGLLAFRSIGLIIASVANSMQESQIIIQLMYLPMLFLSGATFPISMMPTWLQVVGQFLPASYLYTGMQGILVQNDGLAANAGPLGALFITLCVATLLGVKLFRWEKDDKMPAKAKLWLAAVLLPFLVLGTYQAYSLDNVSKAKVLYREMRRNRPLLIRGPRIFTGDGKVITAGGVLLRDGRIAEIYETVPPEPDSGAATLEAAGKTLLPGLNDAYVQLLAPGGVLESYKDYDPTKATTRALAAYLYCGVSSVRSAGDAQSAIQAARHLMERGDRIGSQLFSFGKIFTTPGGRGTEYFRNMPESVRGIVERETVFLPTTAAEARQQVQELKSSGADGVQVMLDAGQAGALRNRMDTSLLTAIAGEARKLQLPLTVWTGDSRDVADAIAAGATTISHGSTSEALPETLFTTMAKNGIAYMPTLAAIDAAAQFRSGTVTLLDSTLVQQVAPEGLLNATRKVVASRKAAAAAIAASPKPDTQLDTAMENLRRAHKAGVRLITGTGSGTFLLVHGPAIHRELQLWVKAGIPAADTLRAATANTAAALGRGNSDGIIRKGSDASLLLVDGNPLTEIAATERISSVFLKGERIDRAGLFDQEK